MLGSSAPTFVVTTEPAVTPTQDSLTDMDSALGSPSLDPKNTNRCVIVNSSNEVKESLMLFFFCPKCVLFLLTTNFSLVSWHNAWELYTWEMAVCCERVQKCWFCARLRNVFFCWLSAFFAAAAASVRACQTAKAMSALAKARRPPPQ